VLEQTSLQKKIIEVEVEEDLILVQDVDDLRSSLKNRVFVGTDRHGKHLFAETDRDRWLMLHFGMTGSLEYRRRHAEKPKYTKILFRFPESYLAYVSIRKLGEATVLDSWREFTQERELGPDALRAELNELYSAVGDRWGMLKTRLMDQSIIAGVGNVYSDETCFRAGIHPTTDVAIFDEEDWRTILSTMKTVLRDAVDKLSQDLSLPDEWLASHRASGQSCPSCGTPIKRIQVSSRGCYFCPRCQE
jgi:formamidopyrimidine-DNA glycosylase